MDRRVPSAIFIKFFILTFYLRIVQNLYKDNSVTLKDLRTSVHPLLAIHQQGSQTVSATTQLKC